MRDPKKTNPNHKARFNVCIEAVCSCGWKSSIWVGSGARSNAAGEWRSHREKCEAKEDDK